MYNIPDCKALEVTFFIFFVGGGVLIQSFNVLGSKVMYSVTAKGVWCCIFLYSTYFCDIVCVLFQENLNKEIKNMPHYAAA